MILDIAHTVNILSIFWHDQLKRVLNLSLTLRSYRVRLTSDALSYSSRVIFKLPVDSDQILQPIRLLLLKETKWKANINRQFPRLRLVLDSNILCVCERDRCLPGHNEGVGEVHNGWRGEVLSTLPGWAQGDPVSYMAPIPPPHFYLRMLKSM